MSLCTINAAPKAKRSKGKCRRGTVPRRPSAMRNRQRDSARRDARRQSVANLFLAGKTQREIGAALGVDHSTVSRDLAALREQWQQVAERDFRERAAVELARIDHLEAVAWAAWERSCQQRVNRKTKKTKGRVDKDGALLPDLDSAERTEADRDGNPRFLDRVAWCIQKRCEMLGILKPEVGGVSTVTTVVNGVDLDVILGRKPEIPVDRPRNVDFN
jgi:Homeodomain-like domain